MCDAWSISIFVGFDFHSVDALRLMEPIYLEKSFLQKGSLMMD